MALVAFVAAVGFVLAGPATDASAAPPPPDPAAGSPANEPGRWDKLSWSMYGWAHHSLDPNDPYYQVKLPVQHIIKWQFKRATNGGTTFSPRTDGPDIAETLVNYYRESRQTLKGLTKQVAKAEKKVRKGEKRVAAAKTPAELEQAKEKLRKSVKQYKYVSGKLRDVKKAQPESTGTQVKRLDRQVRKLEKKIRKLERRAADPRQTRTEAGRALVKQQIHDTRTALSQAQAERDRLRGPDDDGDTGGTRTTPRDPKQPPKGPVSTGPTTTSTTSKGTTGAKGNKGTTATGPTTTPKGTRGTTATGPTASWKGWSSLKTPKTGFRGSTGTNQMADAISGVIADGISQDYAAYLDRKNQQLLEQARKDPDLAKRIIDDYNEIKDNNGIEVLFRSFDTSKGFTQDATRQVAPELIKSQKALDTAKAVADRSNADPLYQQARTECGGYDTCVTERTAKLRKQNAKAIAESTKNAHKSNADPLYQQARTECGGYDTCVTERTAKLRKQNAKAIAESTKNAHKSNADPLYQQARTECGGYDTCVTERTAKLRAQKKATTTATTRATDVHKTTTAKTSQTDQHKTQNTKAIAESTKKAAKSNADPLYQQARTECGGYDTCVTERTAKLRAQEKATTAKSTTRTGQHNQPQKKTQTPDYRGKGGVRASAA
ncbi:hypothetical protein C5746_42985 [Streptomyces atratus]|uniref:Uncharacterized protein n=2 Tax=Streptomyces atratus TaxID=1893 RepID=A0A2Z5J5V7_STRAR|nr:hypothetical protein C5746_00250 [Streptomyces atratus]AXE82477.1 hypothetical protein C5746_42985 [Streptomyces atratus]